MSEVQIAGADQYDGLPEDERFARSKLPTSRQLSFLQLELVLVLTAWMYCCLQSAKLSYSFWASQLPLSS